MSNYTQSCISVFLKVCYGSFVHKCFEKFGKKEIAQCQTNNKKNYKINKILQKLVSASHKALRALRVKSNLKNVSKVITIVFCFIFKCLLIINNMNYWFIVTQMIMW